MMGSTYNFEIIVEVTRNNVSGDPRRFALAAGGILPPVTVILCSCQDVCISDVQARLGLKAAA